MDAVPLGQCLDDHPGQVVADERIYLGGGEKSLSRLDSPHNKATIVPRSGALGTPRDLVDPTIQAVDQGFRRGAELPNVLPRHPTWPSFLAWAAQFKASACRSGTLRLSYGRTGRTGLGGDVTPRICRQAFTPGGTQ